MAKKTQAEKVASGSKKAKSSKYALKVARRVKAAREVGLELETPYPVINAPEISS